MIWFLYFGNYPYFEEDGERGIFDGLRFSLHANVFSLATKCGLPVLRQLANKHFRNASKHHWDDHLFTNCIPIVYGSKPSTDRGLRDLIIREITKRFTLESIMDDETDRTFYLELFSKYPQFSSDLLSAMYPGSDQKKPMDQRNTRKLPTVDKACTTIGISMN